MDCPYGAPNGGECGRIRGRLRTTDTCPVHDHPLGVGRGASEYRKVVSDMGPCEACGATHVPRRIVRHGGETHVYCENVHACNRRATKRTEVV